MELDYKKIGKRIKEERNKLGLNQTDFKDEVCLSPKARQTIGNWENGTSLPNLGDFIAMSNKFDCEISYLLGEIDCKTHVTNDIHNATGLSEEAISTLLHYKNLTNDDTILTLSSLLENPLFYDFLRAIHLHVGNFNKGYLKGNSQDVQLLAKAYNCSTKEALSYLETSSQTHIQSQLTQILKTLP